MTLTQPNNQLLASLVIYSIFPDFVCIDEAQKCLLSAVLNMLRMVSVFLRSPLEGERDTQVYRQS